MKTPNNLSFVLRTKRFDEEATCRMRKDLRTGRGVNIGLLSKIYRASFSTTKKALFGWGVYANYTKTPPITASEYLEIKKTVKCSVNPHMMSEIEVYAFRSALRRFTNRSIAAHSERVGVNYVQAACAVFGESPYSEYTLIPPLMSREYLNRKLNEK